MGIVLLTEQAREAIRKHPQLLGFSVETMQTGWAMLTSTDNGRGLSPEEARKCILRGPQILSKDDTAVVLRVELLESLGYAGALALMLKQPSVLDFKEETVKENVAWLRG